MDFIPKIVRWGMRFGGTNPKYGNHIKGMQWGVGGSNSSSRRKSLGKVYGNKKQDRISRNSMSSLFTRR